MENFDFQKNRDWTPMGMYEPQLKFFYFEFSARIVIRSSPKGVSRLEMERGDFLEHDWYPQHPCGSIFSEGKAQTGNGAAADVVSLVMPKRFFMDFDVSVYLRI